MPDAYTDADFDILPNKEAIAAFNAKMIGSSFSYLDVLAHEHAVAFTVAKMMDADMLAETRAAISAALENGTDFRDFKKRLKPYMMSQGWWGERVMTDPKDGNAQKVQLGSTRRLRTIYQTNLHTAYAAGQWERIQNTKDALPYLQYMPSLATRKRRDHKRYYGIIRPVDDPIWQQILPPNGYGCLCWVKQLTRAQAERAGGVTPDDDLNIEYKEVENSRTGKKERVLAGITPSFAHNHGDRLGALLKIAADKHGSDFTKQLLPQIDDYMLRLLKPEAVNLVSFAGIAARQSEIDRLVGEGVRDYEAELADQWQQHYDADLKGFEQGVHKVRLPDNPPDLVKVERARPAAEWQTLDIMFKIAENADVKAFNRSFNKSEKAWDRSKANIIKHLEKADIVPMYLDSFDTNTRIKLLSFVLSLSPEQQRRIVLIIGGGS